MDPKSILLACPDPQELFELTQALGSAWEATSVTCDVDALAQLESRDFDALLVDFNLGSPDSSELLNLASERHPQTNRFLLAHEADLALVAAKVVGELNILPKPFEPDSIKSRIESAVADPEPQEPSSQPSSGATEPPEVPPVYDDLAHALQSPEVTIEQVAEIIARDEALTSELLKLTRSSYQGVPRNLSDPLEAVESLGLETVKALVLALQFLAEHKRLKPGSWSLDQLWQHSLRVGQIARDLILFETKDRSLASQALAAGLVHDLGKVVLATNFEDLYGRVYSLARKQPVALWEVEREMFGASHGEIGACLVGMWNLPKPVVDATALHHEPPLGETQQLTPLAAVHIANVLEHQLRSDDEELMVAPIINSAFLNELGLLQRLPVWRAAFANRRLAEFDDARSGAPEPTAPAKAARSRSANHLPGPLPATQSATSGTGPRHETDQPSAARTAPGQSRWVYAVAAGGLLLAGAFWLGTQFDSSQTDSVYARSTAAQPTGTATTAQTWAPVEASAVPDSDPAPAAPAQVAPPEITPSQVAPAVAAAEAPPVLQVASKPAIEPAPAPAQPSASGAHAEPAHAEPAATSPTPAPAPEPAVATAPQVTATNAPDTAVAPPPEPKVEYRLSAIIYTPARPSAIVNGRTVYVGGRVFGAIVVSIQPTAVVLERHGERTTLELK